MSVKQISAELGIKDTALRRWLDAYGLAGDDDFPGNKNPSIIRTMKFPS